MKKMFYVAAGCLGLMMGAIGVILPMWPSVPFLMLAAYCFARSSKRLNDWFKATRLYQENLKDFVARRGMTKKAKVRIMVMVTLLMSIGFIMMGRKGIIGGCVVLGLIWLLHLGYFIFGIKTISDTEGGAAS